MITKVHSSSLRNFVHKLMRKYRWHWLILFLKFLFFRLIRSCFTCICSVLTRVFGIISIDAFARCRYRYLGTILRIIWWLYCLTRLRYLKTSSLFLCVTFLLYWLHERIIWRWVDGRWRFVDVLVGWRWSHVVAHVVEVRRAPYIVLSAVWAALIACSSLRKPSQYQKSEKNKIENFFGG